MKRSFSFSTSLTVGVITLLAAVPAFAQEYSYSGEGDAAAGAALCGIYACIMIPAIVLGIFNLWMLIDAILRQEYEYPDSTGNAKLIWILLLVFVGLIAAIFYYFMVFKKIKRGKAGPPPVAGVGSYQPPVAPPAPPMAPPAPPAPPVAPPAPPVE